MPVRVEGLLLRLRLVHLLAVELEDDIRIGLAAAVDAPDPMTVDELDAYHTLVYSTRQRNCTRRER